MQRCSCFSWLGKWCWPKSHPPLENSAHSYEFHAARSRGFDFHMNYRICHEVWLCNDRTSEWSLYDSAVYYDSRRRLPSVWFSLLTVWLFIAVPWVPEREICCIRWLLASWSHMKNAHVSQNMLPLTIVVMYACMMSVCSMQCQDCRFWLSYEYLKEKFLVSVDF